MVEAELSPHRGQLHAARESYILQTAVLVNLRLAGQRDVRGTLLNTIVNIVSYGISRVNV